MELSLSRRIAAAMSLIAFAVCLVAGIEADNPLGTILARSLVAMAGTLVIGLVVGAMAQKMLDEHLATTRQAGGEPAIGKGTPGAIARKEPRA
jgi:putative Mn2+ efflux pump MntP